MSVMTVCEKQRLSSKTRKGKPVKIKYTGDEKNMYYQGRQYLVFVTSYVRRTVVYVFPDNGDSGKNVNFVYRHN